MSLPATPVGRESRDSAAQQLIQAGWEFRPGEHPPVKSLARPVAAGRAGVLEYIGRPHVERCHIPHDHAIHRYCQHGAWHLPKAAKLPWQRTAQLRLLDRVCACPLGMVVSEFHPVGAADEQRRSWEPEMNSWLDSYLTAQPDCRCVPLLRLGAVLGDQGTVVHVLAVLYHDPTACPVRGEPIETLVGAELPAWAR